MKKLLFLLYFSTFFTLTLFAQHIQEGVDSVETQRGDIDVNFLFSYYEQDGNHSAVTGGIGTEELTDIEAVTIINVPLTPLQAVNVTAGFSYYSSASTDKIDARVSSASSVDARTRFNIGFENKKPKKNITYGFSGGGSIESDYISFSMSGQWGKEFSNNRKLSLLGSAFFDTWVLYFPEELRGTGRDVVSTPKRRSFSMAATYSGVVNKRMQGAVTAELIYQAGLLSTPFHRVYSITDTLPKVENLPLHRFKFPLGLRLHYFAADWLVTRFYGKLYADSFGILGTTFQLELPFKVNRFFSISPLYRFHIQSAATYFYEFEKMPEDAAYFTSDYDLSAFTSHKTGVGIYYAPLWGVGRAKPSPTGKVNPFRSIDVRYVHYWRSDGLVADMVSMGLQFVF